MFDMWLFIYTGSLYSGLVVVVQYFDKDGLLAPIYQFISKLVGSIIEPINNWIVTAVGKGCEKWQVK